MIITSRGKDALPLDKLKEIIHFSKDIGWSKTIYYIWTWPQ